MTTGLRSRIAVASGLLLVLFLAAELARAQDVDRRFSYGAAFAGGPKFWFVQRPGMRYGPVGEFNIGMYAGYSGNSPRSMTARLHAQLSRDNISVHLAPGESYIIESLSFLVNPEIGIPLHNRNGESKLELIAGIGFDFLTGQSMAQRNISGFFGGGYLDDMNDSIRAARRDFIPFATGGLALKVHRRLSIVVRIRQDAQNAFTRDSPLTFHGANESRTVSLSTQATRLLIGCQIRFGKLPEAF